MVGDAEQQAVAKMGHGPQWKLFGHKIKWVLKIIPAVAIESHEAGRDLKAEKT